MYQNTSLHKMIINKSLVTVDKKYTLLFTFIFFFLSFLQSSCSYSGSLILPESMNATTIDFDTVNTKVVYIDEIVDSVYFVKLETHEKCLIGNIDQVLLLDSEIVIVDYYIAKSIYLFDYAGHFLNRISRIGNANNEYLGINCVYVNSRKEICIVDNIKHRISTFSKEGLFVKSQEYPYLNRGVDYIKDDTLVFYVADCEPLNGNRKIKQSCYVITDDKIKPVYYFGQDPSFEYPDFNLTRKRNIYHFGENVYCVPNFGNIIYKLTTDSVIAQYKLSIKPGTIFTPKASDFESSLKMITEIKKAPSFTGDFIECKDFSLFRYEIPSSPERYQWVIYKHDNESLFSLKNRCNNSILHFFYKPTTMCGENIIVETVSAQDICSYRDLTPMFKDDVFLYSLFEGITIDSNPVILFYKIKDW